MGHSISTLSPEHNRNASTTAGLSMSPQLYDVMGGSVQYMKTETKLDAPDSKLQTNQDTINLMKRPAEGIGAPQKKSRKTKSHNDVEESDRDRDYYSGSGEADKKKEETFACPFYRKDPALKLRSDRRISSAAQWHEIWVLLFGTTDTTPKPFLDGIAKEMTGIIRGIWSQDGSQIVSMYVQERGLPSSPGQLLSLLPELLDKVEDRFENEPLKNKSEEQHLDIKGHITEANIGATGNSYQGSTTLGDCPYRPYHGSDFGPVSNSSFLPSHLLKSMSVARYHCDPHLVEEALEPGETDSECATTSFGAHTEPLICMTAFDPAEHPYGIFQHDSLSQTAGTEIYHDWLRVSDDYSLNFLEE
ncbi:hypothetical protein F52700_6641 [Fusarium sp. NRRL 52700]|nr:hypothetical protein F52700_6641 [Fusarium sp. NRRL 52700]